MSKDLFFSVLFFLKKVYVHFSAILKEELYIRTGIRTEKSEKTARQVER